jgi:uncharacterized membrane protein YczE
VLYERDDAMKLFIEDLYQLPKLIAGFIIMSFGIMLIKRSELGLFAWGVLHDGIANVTPFTFGQVIQILGLVILVLSMIAFKTRIGIGTILNIVLVGWIIDYWDMMFIYQADTMVLRIVFLLVGISIMNIGRALYISSKLGAGPRDGMFVGVSYITKIDVKYVKPGIEVLVLVIGYFLGGVAGIGTLITMLASGYMVQYFFKVFGFNPKEERQRNMLEYFKQPKKDTV